MRDLLTPERCLPQGSATLVGRAWVPGSAPGPAVVAVRDGDLWDLGPAAPTMSDLLEAEDPASIARSASGTRLGPVAEILANSVPEGRDSARPWLLAPCDLQAVKASGVTFVASLLERVIEEQARGDAARAEEIRTRVVEILGEDLAAIRPGSEEAARIKEVLLQQGAWSQYLEVGIGPDAEIFTKAQPLSSVGTGAEIGIHPVSTWNNPEPEVVLAVDGQGRVRGATLGNDVNLRDVEGRSALLLGKAKDNAASCAIGPFIRLFDEGFGIEQVRRIEISLTVDGPEGYRLSGRSSMSAISRDPLDLVAQAIGPNHQYPDGLMLFLGTMFAPVEDRGEPGRGFTHKLGDVVTIAAPELGALVNRVNRTDRVEPWTFGTRALLRSLAARGLLQAAPAARA
ncbi:fumarylacetoacetate hydrolase family protein [Arenibaculum pallidiluteum]|uniref:fumarylacetoacetate hydrolase family protein n=1 Tax=Arenibaculum pallidiluteum TaxID=2812559 RepID=UPI001A96C2B5|nr:fumarylacetoacetate hydrolase family protein [Arenibaculum pallidiluteum]